MEIDDASNQSTTSVVGTTVTNPLQNDGSLPNGSSNVPPLPSNNVLNVSNSNLQGTSMFSFDFIVKISLSATEKHKFSGTAVIIPSNTCNNVQSSTVPTQMTTPESLSGSQLNTATVSLATMTIDDAPTILSSTPQTMFSNVQVVNLNAVRAGTPTQTANRSKPPQRLTSRPKTIGARPGQSGVSYY